MPRPRRVGQVSRIQRRAMRPEMIIGSTARPACAIFLGVEQHDEVHEPIVVAVELGPIDSRTTSVDSSDRLVDPSEHFGLGWTTEEPVATRSVYSPKRIPRASIAI